MFTSNVTRHVTGQVDGISRVVEMILNLRYIQNFYDNSFVAPFYDAFCRPQFAFSPAGASYASINDHVPSKRSFSKGGCIPVFAANTETFLHVRRDEMCRVKKKKRSQTLAFMSSHM